MADLLEIKRIAEAAARRSLKSTPIDGISIEDEVGEDGDELLRVRIVVPDGEANGIDTEQFFAAVLAIKDALQRAGDDRRALVGFITPSEIEQRDDPES